MFHKLIRLTLKLNINKKRTKIIVFFLFSVFFIFACKTITKVMNTISDLENIQFKLGTVEMFSVSNINISNIKSISDVSVSDGLKLTQSFANKSLPTNFTLNVVASNPNKKSNKNPSTLDAIINSFDWILFVDEKETINGKVTTPLTVPSSTQNTIIPVRIGIDLYKFFGDKGYTDIINLALALGGANGSSSRLKLKMKPQISIAGFPLSYPNYITVVDKEFRSK